MSNYVRSYYRRFRSAGMSAAQALESARVVDRFEDLESEGYVRIRCEVDTDADYDSLKCDCGDKHCRHNEILQRDGAYGTIGEYRTDLESDNWHHADSCWGHVGYNDASSPFENWYVIDHMSACIDQVIAAELA